MKTGPNAAVVAVSGDLMDSSKIRAALPSARVLRTPTDLGSADVVLVDLAVAGALEQALATGARVIAYGSHVDEATLADARTRGAVAMPRSRFFRSLAEGTLLEPG